MISDFGLAIDCYIHGSAHANIHSLTMPVAWQALAATILRSREREQADPRKPCKKSSLVIRYSSFVNRAFGVTSLPISCKQHPLGQVSQE